MKKKSIILGIAAAVVLLVTTVSFLVLGHITGKSADIIGLNKAELAYTKAEEYMKAAEYEKARDVLGMVAGSYP